MIWSKRRRPQPSAPAAPTSSPLCRYCGQQATERAHPDRPDLGMVCDLHGVMVDDMLRNGQDPAPRTPMDAYPGWDPAWSAKTWDVTITLTDGETIELRDVSDDGARELETLPFTTEGRHVAIVQARSTDLRQP